MKVSATSYDFGLATAGTAATFKITNNGNTDYTISASATGGYGTSLSTTTLNQGEEATLTVTMPSTTANGVVTISSSDTNIADATINVSGTVKDPNKYFEDFSGNALPENWTKTDASSSYYWSFNSGYAAYNGYSSSYAGTLTTRKLNFTAGEKFFFDAKINSTYASSSAGTIVQYSTDGTTFTNLRTISASEISTSVWNTFSVEIPSADVKYIRFASCVYFAIDNVYGGSIPTEPNMVVTQPADLSFGLITGSTTKTFTIANTGLATLNGITVASNNNQFTISNAPTTLAAGTSAEVTITMAATAVGNQSATITVSATDQTDVTFDVSGTVLPSGLSVIDFNDNQLPARWENTGWTFNNGAAYAAYHSPAYVMTTPKIMVADGDLFVIKAMLRYSGSYYYVTVNGSSDNGATWTAYTKTLSSELNTTDYTAILIDDIPATVNKLQFVGYYGYIDEIQGINYAPELSVTKAGTAVSTPDSYDFGECAADATVTYNFANAGAGTINITNVVITGPGAAAYSTNWTASAAVPYDLVITRTYDASRAGTAQAAVVTVTTSEGDFVINVTGTDLAADAPALSVSLGGVAVATGDAADFGTKLQAAPAAKTYTITNLTGTIATSDNTQFTVSETTFSLGANASMTFDVALVFDTNYGAKTATITIHPTNDGLSDIVINATASTMDPEAWTENFAAGTLPTGWTQGTWTIGTFSSYENTTTMALAPSGSTAGTIITPCLSAKAGDVLSWDGYFNWYDEAMTVEYSNDDQATWTKIYNAYKAQEDFGSTRYTHKEMSFTAPADGNYYLRFTSTYSNGVDNFAGFKLNLPDHICVISASSIPSSTSYSPSMKEGQSFNATVTVKENRGVAENLTAKLHAVNGQNDVVVGTATGNVAAKGSTELTITCTPTSETTGSVMMYFEVVYAGGSLTTEQISRYVAPITYLTLDQTSSDALTAGTYDYVTLKRPFLANWNTVCLPFTISNVEDFFGVGASAYNFSSYSNGTVNFSKVTELTASYPYIVFVPAAINDDIELTNITIASGDATPFYRYHDAVYFRGTYAPIAADHWTKNEDTDVIYVLSNADSKLMKAGSSASSKGFRGYFDVPASDAARLSISFDDVATGIGVFTTDGELEVGNMYNMQGQKVQHAGKGIYIINGKKVVLK